MSTTTKVSKAKAQAVLDAVKAQHKAWVEPMLDDDGSVILDAGPPPVLMEEGFDGRQWTIVWEEGPDEWPFTLHGGSSEEDRVLLAQAAEEFGANLTVSVAEAAERKPAALPKGVYVEPINHCSIGVYPA